MILHHGTSSANTAKIQSTGLLPRGERKGNWFTEGKVGSHPEMVYLTRHKKSIEFYGLRSAIIDDSPEWTNISVKIPTARRLYPDENLFVSGISYANEMVRSIDGIKKNKKLWKNSLEERGLVCHKGKIEPSVITDITYHPLKDSSYWFMIADLERPTIVDFDFRMDIIIHLEDKHAVYVNTDQRGHFFEKYEDHTTLYLEDGRHFTTPHRRSYE